ncbi:unnamed protein product [Peronospora farinosa]|uniref:Uncharacterized protein n=1 Tax=Peronospora farinosa TaxID=134698 RepID=A0AAV0TS66_9STRA|nr:unnamed protein product [Peronospora farinosa]
MSVKRAEGLLAQIQMVKPEAEMTEAWVINDMKSLGLIAQGIAVEYFTKIRSATTAIQAWITCVSSTIARPCTIG